MWNIKLWIYAIVGAVIVGLVITLLWYRGSYQSFKSKVEIAEAEKKELKSQVEEYQRDVALIKAHQVRMQEIEQSGSSIQGAVDSLKDKRELTNEEIIVAKSITDRINSGGVLPKVPGSGQVLQPAGKTNIAGNKDNPEAVGKLQ